MNKFILLAALTTCITLVCDWHRLVTAQAVTCTDTAACTALEYCAKTPGSCESQGSCTPRPSACTTEVNPVCGCDGKTYPNACAAATAGVNVVHTDACLGVAFDPPMQNVPVGQPVTVNVVISGLAPNQADEIVGAFDLDIQYDPQILSPTGVTFGSSLADGATASLQATNLATPGVVDFAEVARLTDAQLETIQPGSFVLATLSFTTLAAGTSPLTFVFDHRNDVKGREALMLLLEVKNGSVAVAAAMTPIADLTARAKDGKIDIVWTHVQNATSYNIYRKVQGASSYTLIKEGHVTTFATYADSGLTNGTTYCYVVRWVDGSGQQSPDSNQACATPTRRQR